jgi:metal-sulfur cluster biosynthetic enzyme
VSASMAATTRSRCSVSASIIEGVSMALNYKTTCRVRTSLSGRWDSRNMITDGKIFGPERMPKNPKAKSHVLAAS